MDAAYLENLAYTLSTRRSALPWRSFVVVNSVETLSDLQNRISKPVSAGQSKGIAFVFTGQGAQYRSMGAGLLGHPTFKYWIDRFGEKLKDLGCTWSMADVMDQTDSSADINDPEYSQPLTTGLQIALYELLQTLGVGPSVVLGHSSGEIATAYAAGCLSLDSAAKVSYYRGICSSALKRSLKQAGAMMSVNLPVDEMQDFFTRTGREPQAICVACINSPRNVTISGDEAVVDEVGRDLEARGVRTHKLKTGVAYHSRHHTAQVAAQYAESIACLERGTKRAKRPIMLSSVTGKYVQDPGEVCTPEYWVTNLVSQVQFAGAMRTLSVLMGKKTPTRKLGSPKLDAIRDVVEVGPHSALRRPIMECLQHAGVQANVRYHAVLNRQARASQAALKLAGELYARGYAVDVQKANEIGLSLEHKTNLQALVDLPPYPFNHSRIYWYESPLSRHGRLRCQPKLELLGTPAADWTPLAPRWRKFFDPTETPWIGHHRVNGKAIYPATGMAVMAIEASAQMADPARRIAGYELRDAIFSAPIIVGGEGEKRTEVQLHMWPDGADKNASAWEYRVCSQRNGVWVEHCCGAIRVQYETPGHARVQSDENLFYRGKYNEALRACTFKVPTEIMYENFEANGLNYGPPFRALDDLAWDGAHDAVGTLQCFQWTPKQSQNDRQPHVAHPVTLDAAGQLMWVALTKGAQEVLVNGAAVTRIQHAWIAGSGASYPGTPYLRAACTTSLKGLRGTDASIFALDPEGRLRLRMSHVETTAVGGDETSTVAAPRRICFEMSYKPDIDLLDAAQLAVFTRPSPNGRPDQSGAEPQSNPETFYHDLELALFCLAMRALAEVEGAPTPTTKPHLTKYLAWLRRQTDRLSQQPRFSLVATTTTTHPLLGLLHDDDNLLCGLEDLLSRLERTNTEGAFLVHIARHLPGILRGEADPLDLMFNTGLAGAHYAGVCAATACCAGLAPYVDALAHKWPGLRVLEVGAGTGAITGYILRAVGEARLGRYDYTDVSAAIFEGARERFGEMGGRMAYKILDVERDPTEQGFEVEGYDLVVAAWVLHATRDLARTVQNVRRLLKPQGKLVLMEITEPEILRNGFAFGTLPGWWLSEEEEREWSPCVSEAQWDRVLRQNGFQGVDVVIRDYESDVCHENSLLIATAFDPGPNAGVGPMLTLVLDPDSGPQAKLAAEFAGQMREKTGVGCQLLPIQNALSVAPGSTVVFLAELVKPYLSTLDEPSFGNLQALLAAAGNVIWLTSACEASPASAELQMVRGLARVLNTEKPGRSFVAVSFEDGSLEDNHDLCVNHLCRVVSGTTASQSQGCELEYVQRDGLLMINRVFESSAMNLQVHSRCHPTLQHQPLSQSPPLVLTIPNPGLLDSLRFIADPRYVTPLAPDEIEIAVQAIGINFRDLLTILGKLASSTTTGCECAGTVTRVGSGVTGLVAGDRVCAVVFGCTSTHARCHYQLAVQVPSFLSTAEAAALPVTGVTAHRALVTLARLQKDESILIHSAAGGTGQMALQLAVSLGADVYVTVGTEEKRALMRDVYGLPEHRIFYSRDTSFARDVYRTTNGRGVDVVVNSLAGDALLASWECVAPFGRFVELGKADIEGNAKLPMAMFAKNVTFFAVGVDDLAKHRPGMVQSALREVMDMVESGRMKVAEPLHVYPLSEMETAFRTMQAGKNTGKTVLTVSPENVVPVSPLDRSRHLQHT
jgi:acyl transferase domain-containing protein/NADPH:quinone reductase-like Zn-dependent oxidoreductase/ubiquinone/menaquinone biosynthesis C-methylase UbiE